MYKFKRILQWFGIIVGIIMLAIGMRVFLFATFTIPTPSMEPAIMSGDRIVVNKSVPGPRIMTNFFSRKKGEEPNYIRLPGLRAVKRNDILVFNYPYIRWGSLDIDLSRYYAKRCVAIPGDTFYIENGIYKVKGITDTLGNYQRQEEFYHRKKERIRHEVFNCFPFDSEYNWNVKNFGPFYIPAKGDTIPIDIENIALYKNIILYETKKNIRISGNAVYLNDDKISHYTFIKNYYFMAGDLTFDSQDSRYWGLLPEDHIVGKASLVYKSVDPESGKTRNDRFLKFLK